MMDRSPIDIRTPDIQLDAFLKFAGVAATGGEAKLLIRGGRVRVNGAAEERRGHRVRPGDTVDVLDDSGAVAAALVVRAATEGQPRISS